mgnify:CR=1 FL=1
MPGKKLTVKATDNEKAAYIAIIKEMKKAFSYSSQKQCATEMNTGKKANADRFKIYSSFYLERVNLVDDLVNETYKGEEYAELRAWWQGIKAELNEYSKDTYMKEVYKSYESVINNIKGLKIKLKYKDQKKVTEFGNRFYEWTANTGGVVAESLRGN